MKGWCHGQYATAAMSASATMDFSVDRNGCA